MQDWWPWPKTCILGIKWISCWCKCSFCKGKLALSDSIESAPDSRAKSYTLGFGESAADSMKSEGASSGFASASDWFASGSASFPLQPKHLHQHLMHLIPSMQVFLPHKGAPSFSLSVSCASPSPFWLCMMFKITKGYHFFLLWRYLYCLLVPGVRLC